MRYPLVACLLAAGLGRAALADEAALKDARQRWLKGNYVEAQERFEKLLKDEKDGAEAAVGLSRCLQSQGEYDKAADAVESGLRTRPGDVSLLSRKAELLQLRGKWEEAEKAADAAIALDKDAFAARWVRAQVYRERGELKKADAEFRWFVRTYSARSEAEKDIKDPGTLVLVALAGAENARWNHLADQFEFILQEVLGDAVKYDRHYWPAEYQAGVLLLEKYNRGEGLAALDKALIINPSAAEAIVGKGVAALQRMEIRDAERFAEQALKINLRLPEALRLRADVYLATGDVTRAMRELESARAVNPRDEETLGRIAACLRLQKKQDDLEKLTQEVQKRNPTPGLYHFVLGSTLEDRRRYDEAEKHLKLAKELRPMLAQASNSLGILYMRMGKEKEAGELLRAAKKADPFNVRVSNSVKVLDHLKKYRTIKTAHFELRYDPKADPVLGPYMAEYLEGVHAKLSKEFKHAPSGPILIELFNNHEMFSGRVVALPDLHTIGACTGPMVAMVSPNGKGIRKPFNWGRVIRHEVVHVFNLDQTRYLCPHWFTEGLAVMNEGFARPQSWNDLLRTRVPSGEGVFNLDTIDLGFIRPRSPSDWTMAYCQAQLYIEYLVKEYGQGAVGDMLNAYRDGLDTGDAIRKVCKVSKADFDKGYRRFLEGVASKIVGKATQKEMTLGELRDANKKNPDDPDAAARLAETLLRRGERAEARKLAKAALGNKAKHPLASYVMARLALLAGDNDEAKKLLEDGLDEQNVEPKLARALGKLYFDAGDFKKAAEIFEQGHKAEPYDNEWLTQLARVYGRLENTDKQIEVLKELVRGAADNLDDRKRLARLLTSAKRPAEAEQYARECLEINIKDKEAQETLLSALDSQKKAEEAARLRKLLGK
jgi:tetratricopeptide (TPR) repeat protein